MINSTSLSGKKILVAVTGSIAAVKAPILVSRLIKARFIFLNSKKPKILILVFDMFRIGLSYGLFSEGLKLL